MQPNPRIETLCPSAAELASFASGAEVSLDLDALADHIDHCARCEQILASVDLERLVAPANQLTLSATSASTDTLAEDYQSLRGLLLQLPLVCTPTAKALQNVADPQHIDFRDQEIRAIFGTPGEGGPLGELGPFRFDSVIGRGGMGIVFSGFDNRLYRNVAIKVMRITRASDPQLVERFYREAKALAAIESENVVRIYEVGELRTPLGPLPYLSMELLNGESLDRFIPVQQPTYTEIFSIAIQITKGLAAVHKAGLVHRDIKPSNMWIHRTNESGSCPRVRLLDFGLVHFSDDHSTLTQTGDLIGTPAYMSPEAATGKSLGPCSDLFSLGVVLYELSAGVHPFMRATTPATLLALTRENPVPVHRLNSTIPIEFSRIVMGLLEKNVVKRTSSSSVLLRQLHAIEAEVTSNTTPTQLASQSCRWYRHPRYSNHFLAIGISICVFAVCAAVGWIIQLQTNMGTIVIESPREDVEINILKNGKPFLQKTKDRSIRVSAGDYQIELPDSFDTLSLSESSINVSRGATQTIRILLVDKTEMNAASAASTQDPAGHASKNVALAESASTYVWQPVSWGVGSTKSSAGEWILSCPQNGYRVYFGELELKEFDLDIEVLQEEGNGNVFILFAANPPHARHQLSLGSFRNTYLGIDAWRADQWTGLAGVPWVLERERWYKVHVRVRDSTVTATVDGRVQVTSQITSNAKGMLGLGIASGKTKFRNLCVTLPSDEVILHGFPPTPLATTE